MSILPNRHPGLEQEFININESAQKLLNNPFIAKDIWRAIDDLELNINQHKKVLTISFESIQQDWLKLLAKLYTLVRSQQKLSANNIRDSIYYINSFSQFIEQRSISNLSQIDNQLFDEYDSYLHSLKITKNTISLYYTTLANFFNLCREEGWLKINTHWFRGRRKDSPVKRDEIEYIPEEVWQQLDEHLHHLPEPLQRMVLIIRGTGLRIGELLNLPLDCLRQRGNQWRLRFLTEKYRTLDELPICEELVLVIKEQQEYIKQHFDDSYDKLFNSNAANPHHYIPVPKVMDFRSLSYNLNKLAQRHKICTNEGQIWYFKSHQFRKTLATVMTNAGVRDLIIQKWLRHRSPEMQEHYKRLLKGVLGQEYQELMKNSSYVDSTGKIVAQHQLKNPITELIRRKMYQVTTQYGECHRPVLKSPCQTVNACWQCEHWLTSTEDLPAIKNDLERVEIELDIVSRLGMVRQQQGLKADQKRLVIRIEGLEKIDDRD